MPCRRGCAVAGKSQARPLAGWGGQARRPAAAHEPRLALQCWQGNAYNRWKNQMRRRWGSPLTTVAAVDDPYARASSRVGVFLWDLAMRPAPNADKSFTYFALLEAFDMPGCPVCRFMTEYSIGYLDALFYEQVNDVGLRRKLRASRGFCSWHAWQAKQITRSALGVAIIANDLISEELTRLDDLLQNSALDRQRQPLQTRIALKAWRAFLQAYQRKGLCPACEVILRHEWHALETMVHFIMDEDFA